MKSHSSSHGVQVGEGMLERFAKVERVVDVHAEEVEVGISMPQIAWNFAN
jgi:hypothetical protein